MSALVSDRAAGGLLFCGRPRLSSVVHARQGRKGPLCKMVDMRRQCAAATAGWNLRQNEAEEGHHHAHDELSTAKGAQVAEICIIEETLAARVAHHKATLDTYNERERLASTVEDHRETEGVQSGTQPHPKIYRFRPLLRRREV